MNNFSLKILITLWPFNIEIKKDVINKNLKIPSVLVFIIQYKFYTIKSWFNSNCIIVVIIFRTWSRKKSNIKTKKVDHLIIRFPEKTHGFINVYIKGNKHIIYIYFFFFISNKKNILFIASKWLFVLKNLLFYSKLIFIIL